MASQIAGTAGSWLRACCSACAAGPDALCSAQGGCSLGHAAKLLGKRQSQLQLPRQWLAVRPNCTSSTATPLTPLHPPRTCVQAGQRDPGGHALGVQLQRARQRILTHRGLQALGGRAA